MKLTENPIFITHKRLVHRGGVMAALLIAGLVGVCLLVGLVDSLHDEQLHRFRTPEESGKMFYGWIVGVEILVLVFGGFTIFDFNRLARGGQYNSAVPIAASIFLDIFNVFLLLLSLFGGGAQRR